MLSLRLYSVFKAVAETGSFTRAAEKLYITQSAVSHAIRELEEQTDAILFDRLGRQARLTAEGRLLFNEITPILSACDSLEKRMGQLRMQAPIQIVSSITIASFWLPSILKKAQKKIPDTPVFVKVVRAAEAARTLSSGDADIAFVEGALPQGPFLSRRFADYPLRLLCSPDYPLPARRMSPVELCREKLLLREPGSAIRDALDSRLLLDGLTAQPTWVSVNSTALLEAAKAGLGITLLPEVLVRSELKAGTLISPEVEGFSLKNDLIALWHEKKHVTESFDAFLSCIA